MPYGSCKSEARLRFLAATQIAEEWLPVILPAIICPRHGSDQICEVCGQPIDRYRIEYQVTDVRDGYEMAFHLLCYRAWQFECRRLVVRGRRRGVPGLSRTAGLPTARRASSRPW